MTRASEAPDELTQLREVVATLQNTLAHVQKENALLRQKVDALVRRLFGSTSEKVDSAQLELLLQLASAAAAPASGAVRTVEKTAEPSPRKQRAPRIPENLP